MARKKRRGAKAARGAADPPASGDFCPNCYDAVSQLDRFCPKCGTLLPGGEEE